MNLEQKLQHALMECERLRQENQFLREQIRQYSINPVATPLPHNHYEPTSISKEQQIQKRLQIFKSLFKGREDVYAVRW